MFQSNQFSYDNLSFSREFDLVDSKFKYRNIGDSSLQIGRGSHLSSYVLAISCLGNDVVSAGTTNINLQCLSECMPCLQIWCIDCKDYSISVLRERVIHFEILKAVISESVDSVVRK